MLSSSHADFCPLCGASETTPYAKDRHRAYFQCPFCSLVFVPEAFWLSPEDEKAEYDLHKNDPEDVGYRAFLSRLVTPLKYRLNPGSEGLDFGCGPGPTLSEMMREEGHFLEIYDPFYFSEPSVLDRNYDFVCATEVVEHFRHPNREWKRLFSLVRSKGWLAIMTKTVMDRARFQNWHYIRDLTHICFYSQSTFHYLAEMFDAHFQAVDKDVFLFQKGL